ncbi:deleted in malignant brain tumors 1 protein-like [Amphibalanus amphitrite]|uniref:deleted in malignant brain tumors 1 protein-like n=1 Tax=Amphibalanus amphitrite TaxID=1232801 RepID=UPI001C92448C|nr:deleted in malignant brain tumors 1 protein-like [Amphibalanus amphitrite]
MKPFTVKLLMGALLVGLASSSLPHSASSEPVTGTVAGSSGDGRSPDAANCGMLGLPCGSDADCARLGLSAAAACNPVGVCSCRRGFRQVSDTECRPLAALGDWCREDADCKTLTSHGVCQDYVCSCADGFWNFNNTECRPVGAVYLHNACVGDQDCSSGGRCVSGTCQCPIVRLGYIEYRLVGGGSCSDGWVELRRGGPDNKWEHVCPGNWDSTDAKVVCKSLGYGSSGRSLRLSYYGAGKPNIAVQEVLCTGSEPHLLACKHRVNVQCSGNEVAGVVCEP